MEQSKGRSPFIDSLRNAIRVRHYSIRTEQSYVGWVKHFIFFHGKRHPKDIGEQEVGAFLTHLAVNKYVRNGKGGKDRVVTLASELIVPIQRHLETVRTVHVSSHRDTQSAAVRKYAT